MQKDSISNIDVKLAMEASITGDTTTTGAIFDTKDYDSLGFAMCVSVRTDGTYTMKLEHGDDAALGDAETLAVDSGHLIYNVLPVKSAVNTDGDKLYKEGVIGVKRYVRASIVSTSVTTGGRAFIVAIGTPTSLPASQV